MNRKRVSTDKAFLVASALSFRVKTSWNIAFAAVCDSAS